MNRFIVLVFFIAGGSPLFAQLFHDTQTVLPTTYFPNVIFGDIDGDGDADVITTGYDYTAILFNDNLNFTRVQYLNDFPGETQLYYQTLDLGDFDRDGTIDILQTGGSIRRVFYVLQNKNLSFSNNQINYGITGSSFFGDFEGDGDLDVIYSGSGSSAGVFINENDSLSSGFGFPDYPTVFSGWTDLDKDSQMDIVQSAATNYGLIGNYLLKRDGDGVRRDKVLNIPGVFYGAAFADHDGDGDLDMLFKDASWNFRIYNYENGNFVNSGIVFPVAESALWADMNNDGRYDVVLAGVEETFRNFETRIYVNNGDGSYSNLGNTGLAGIERSCISAGDIDNDGDLDLAVVGDSNNKLYENTIGATISNTPPLVPANLTESVDFTGVKLQWSSTTDNETASNSLSYNISVKKDDGTIIVPSHSNQAGKRMIYKAGNAFNNTFFNLNCLQEGTYHWTVQAIDAAYLGSSFAQERSFTISNAAPVSPGNLIAKTISDARIDLTWSDNTSNETEYVILRKEVGAPYAQFYSIATVAKNTVHFVDTLYLHPSTEYDYKVIASNCAYKDAFSTLVRGITFPRVYQNSSWLDLGNVGGKRSLLCDFDNDKDLDLLLNYTTPDYLDHTTLFRFDGNGYTDTGISFPALSYYSSSASWIDLNNDGFLDLFFVFGEPFQYTVKFYLNHGGSTFTETNLSATFPFEVLWQGGIAWADYDNDGDQDMLVQGQMTFAGAWTLKIFENKGNLAFEESSVNNLSGFIKSTEPWGDYDNDGDLDLLVNTKITCTSFSIGVFENNGDKSFSYKEQNLAGLGDDLLSFAGDMKWGDLNGDGFLDIVISGQNTCGNGEGITKIYLNSGHRSFSPINTSLTREVYDVQVQWGDYDNDGDRDVFIYGDPFGAFSNITRVYNNDGANSFSKTNIDYLISSSQNGFAQAGDIDNDQDLDYIITGQQNYTTPRIIAYRNMLSEGWGKPNARPSPPGNLKSIVDKTSVTLSWDRANDPETQSFGLTYQFYLIHENDTLVCSNSNPDGTRKIVGLGNAQHAVSHTIHTLEPGHYRWSVQAIDAGYAGSSFSTEQSFEISEQITGLEESVTRGFSLFPNPAAGNEIQLKINHPYLGDIEVVMTDMLGRNVNYSLTKSETNWTGSLVLENPVTGIWIVTARLGKDRLRTKMIRK